MLILDPGHGGTDDPFRLAPDGTSEAQINLIVALGLAEELEKAGIAYRLTRETDQSVTLADRIKSLEPSDLFISIHHNSYNPPDRYSSFPLVYVDAMSQDIGKLLLQCFEATHPHRGSCIDSKIVFDAGIYVLTNSICHAVLGEYDFFSSNCHKRSGFFKDEIDAYFSFIKKYYNQEPCQLVTPKSADIENINKLYPEKNKPSWLKILYQWDIDLYNKLDKQQRICPLIGRLHPDIPHYYG